jgi:hypothetical protein
MSTPFFELIDHVGDSSPLRRAPSLLVVVDETVRVFDRIRQCDHQLIEHGTMERRRRLIAMQQQIQAVFRQLKIRHRIDDVCRLQTLRTSLTLID